MTKFHGQIPASRPSRTRDNKLTPAQDRCRRATTSGRQPSQSSCFDLLRLVSNRRVVQVPGHLRGTLAVGLHGSEASVSLPGGETT